MHHRAIGTAVAVVGALIAVLGLAVMILLGPDGRFTTGPHEVDTDGVAVVTAPTVISWKNVEVEILAEVPANKPVFVGLANSVDLQAYLKGVKRMEVTSFETPWKLRTRVAPGRAALPGAPTAVDWWRAHSAGLGGAAIKLHLPDETLSAAVLSVGSSNLRGLKVTLAYGIQGGFLKGLGLLLIGAGIVWAGLLARRGESLWEFAADGDDDPLTTFAGDESPTEVLPRLDADADADEEHEEHEVLYVYVDEEGVEHEISAEEAAQYEVVEVEHLAESEHEPEPEPASDPAEPVTYFWVDENGVEHEVTAEELHEFEMYDEDES
jgi:hypothetical protein